MKSNFSIESDGTTYECTRTVGGSRVLRQSIYVAGLGSKEDSANYGDGWHPVSSMEGVAHLIAHEIVRAYKK